MLIAANNHHNGEDFSGITTLSSIPRGHWLEGFLILNCATGGRQGSILAARPWP
ncbi:hypothetical protein SSP531S_47510 [Streptomyces spongiicola]|uniref:Uncharacterized protein n=1 Tax=Streptomyces spongiicola TaxID=1690221 RepID=A0A388T528_9ACTN|nr:hypothetical protein SSP531S_47510 [Streptomyces spongiicola]